MNAIPYSFPCRDAYRHWDGNLTYQWYNDHLIQCTFIAQGSRLVTFIGLTDFGNWILFLDLDKGASLSRLDDLFWNTEKLYSILKSKTDATTVASGLLFIHSLF